MVSRNEIHVFLRGGLGNQLFQYALAKYLSSRFSKKLVLREDLLPAESDSIDGISRWPNQLVRFQHSGETFYHSHQPKMRTNYFGKLMQLMRIFGDLAPRATYFLGWLASENSIEMPKNDLSRLRVINSYCVNREIMSAIRNEILSDLEQLANPSISYLNLKQELGESPKTIVHIRKGDYLGLQETYGLITIDFYTQAVEILSQKNQLYPTWIFTDSPENLSEYELKVLKPERVVGPDDIQCPLETLLLMSKARSFIASNSSFSWWASHLNEEVNPIVAPILTAGKVNNFSETADLRDNLVFVHVD